MKIRAGGNWLIANVRSLRLEPHGDRVAAQIDERRDEFVVRSGDPLGTNGSDVRVEALCLVPQIAGQTSVGGVLRLHEVGEGADFRTFRLGLFGLDKLRNVDATVARVTAVLDKVV